MNLAFYCSLSKFSDIINKAVFENGNPGMGGTQYLFILSMLFYNKYYDNQSILLTDVDLKIKNKNARTENVKDVNGCIKYCVENNIKNIVININNLKRIDEKLLELPLNYIIWAHNTVDLKCQKLIKKYKSIKRVVCVSESQFNNMKNTLCRNKCTYINNYLPTNFFEKATLEKEKAKNKKNIVYIGSLFPQKGVHNLIDIWKLVEKKEPEAKLYIVGGAKLWNINSKLGKLNLADRYYEKIIIKKLNKLENKDNIVFLGKMGWDDIKKLLPKISVGVVNPSYYKRDETFCMSAIELAAYGIPVISRKRNDGLSTTIIDEKTGFLRKKNKDIAKAIVDLLNNYELHDKISTEAREYVKRFNVDNTIIEWNKLLNNIEEVEKMKFKLYINDYIFLIHDKFLKYWYYLTSGAIFEKIKRRCFK